MKLKISLIIAVTTLFVLLVLNQPAKMSKMDEYYSYADLVADETRNVLYGACTGCNSVHIMDLDTLEIIDRYTGGSETGFPGLLSPVAMDLSPNGDYLAVALWNDDGKNEVMILDLVAQKSLTKTLSSLTSEPRLFDVQYAGDDLLFTVGTRLHRYDLASMVELGYTDARFSGDAHLSASEDQNTIFVVSSNTLSAYDVNTYPPTHLGDRECTGYPCSQSCTAGDYVYLANGEVLRGDNLTLTETYPAYGNYLACSTEHNRAVYVGYDAVNEQRYMEILELDSGNPLMTLEMYQYATVNCLTMNPGTGDAIWSTRWGPDTQSTDFNIQVYVPANHQRACQFSFYEDFNNPNDGWIVGEDDFLRVQIAGERYNVMTKNGEYIYLFDIPTCYRTDYWVEASVKWLIMEPNASYGVAHTMTEDWSNYYLVDINSHEQLFRELHRTPAGWEWSIVPTYTPAINKDMGENRIQLGIDGTLRTIMINGQIVAQVPTDTANIRGITGTALVTIPDTGTPKCEASFDNIAVYNTESIGSMSDASAGVAYTEPVLETIDWPLPPLDILEQ